MYEELPSPSQPPPPRHTRPPKQPLCDRREALGRAALGILGVGLLARPPPASAVEKAIVEGEYPYLKWRQFREVAGRAKDKSLIGQSTYPVRFVTYLARFLINFDRLDKRLWEDLAREIPFTYGVEEVEAMRRKQFAEFAESVEIGLYDFQGTKGVEYLFRLLVSRYGESYEARKQLAILFTFLDKDQPVELLSQLLAETDNAVLSSVKISRGGNGYTGDKPPKVTVAAPVGKQGKPAEARAVLRETGSIRKIKVVDPGCIYTHNIPPLVEISQPPTVLLQGRRATARAILNNKGGVKEVVITDGGSGYRADSPIIVEFIPLVVEEEESLRQGAEKGDDSSTTCLGAKAMAVLDQEVAEVQVVDGGRGYVLQMGTKVIIEPPSSTGGEADGEQARAFAVLEPTMDRSPDPMSTINDMYSPASLSAQIQQLLPSSVELTYDPIIDRFTILDQQLSGISPTSTMFDPIFGPVGKSPLEKETDLTLESYLRLALSGGFCISIVRTILTPLEIVKTRLQARPEVYQGWKNGIGKILSEGNGWADTFFKGADCTALTGFLLGLGGFGFNEFLRRIITDLVGPGSSEVFSIPIILAASALSTILTSLIVCPIEAVRIRLMSSPGAVEFGGFLRIGSKMYRDMGIGGLYDGLEPLLFREVPFIMTKFLVFDTAQSLLFTLFPASQESLASSLTVSFVSGLMAGVAGAITGCPADAVLTRVNAAPDVVDWRAMVKVMLNSPGGWKNLFAGVDVRMVFFPLVISIQFFLYDWFKTIFDVSTEDLTLVLDVFSATSQTPATGG